MAEGDGGNSGQTEAVKLATASVTNSQQTKTPTTKYTPIELPDTSSSYFYSDDDGTPPKDTRGWKKSRLNVDSDKDKGEASKNFKDDFVLKPAPVAVAEKTRLFNTCLLYTSPSPRD